MRLWKRTQKIRPEHRLLLGAALLLALSSCGKQSFEVSKSKAGQASPGSYLIQPKVDILLAEDDTGSMYEAFTQISGQMPGFLKDLEARGWDIHFAVTGLTHTRTMSQVAAAHYDPNWGSEWVAPYPGAQASTFGMVNPNVFRRWDNFSAFIQIGDVTNGSNGDEPGFDTIWQTLSSKANGTGFVRTDSMLVMLVTGNGEDTSGITYCDDGFGHVVPCNGTYQSSLTTYKNNFLSLRSNNANLLRFYSAVANKVSTNGCLGGDSRIGTRYQWMASALSGASYDICSTPISSLLQAVSQNLHATKLNFRTQYLFIDEPANVSTIVVTKYTANGAVTIPQDPINGWTYMGDTPIQVYAIDFPTQMNLTQGIAIRLNGSAKLVGDETADVQFTPANVHNSP